MEVSVRKATTDDYSAMCELFEEIDSWHGEQLPHVFQKPGGAVRERDYYNELISDENAGVFVAETGGQIVGYVHAIVRDAPALPIFVPRRHAVVDSVVVKAGYQKQGIGARLMDEAQAWALMKGATAIELNVYEFNEGAIAFYEGLGYETLSRKMSKELRRG